MPKKIFAVLIAVVTTFSTFGTSKAVSLDNSTLTDIESHWAENDILTLNRAGILKGANNKANPDLNITRGEFTALISRSLNLNASSSNTSFTDVSSDNVFFADITAAYNAGIVTGMNNDMFYPNNRITREEIMLIISRCVAPSGSKSLSFSDIGKNYQYISDLTAAVSSGIISGYEDGSFKPKNYATRAESASMIVRLMNSMDSVSKSKVSSFAKSYINNDFDNMESNIELSTGNALNELYYRLDSLEEINSTGTKVTKKLSNLEQTDFDNSGLISSLQYSADLTYNIEYPSGDKEIKEYNADISLEIISKDTDLYVYDYTVNLKYDNKINLTWEVYTQAPSYAPEGINVISPSSFQISAEQLNVESTYLSDGINFFNALTSSYMNYANTNNYDVWTIYKTDFTLKTSNNFLNNASSRKKAVELLIKYACKYGIDGINFDFENIYVADRDMLTKHIREVTLALHEMGLIISADVTRKEITSSVWSMCYDRDAISQTADYIMLMAYDEYYAGSSVAGSVSSLDWTEDTIKLTLKEVPAEKLVLGIPLYMRYWETKNGKVTSSKAISMETAQSMISSNDVQYTWIESDKQYKISWQNSNTTCSFWLENAETVKRRTELANKYSLAGIASWRRGLETQDIWSVINKYLF